ncbi:syntaxin-binding protein 5-like [Watersipora subatra]|uniref:syntaxin-binding protein 5-like n=1 Tax=Watersipora subatra TaxID=2589382 RepID=UPI00355B2827
MRGVKEIFSNLRGTEKSSNKGEIEVQESLQSHDFFCKKLMRHGFPYQPTCMAWDPIQQLLAIGTKRGVVRLLGRPGVDVAMVHDGEPIVIRLTFLINEGAFISACSDDSINLWSYRQKPPEIVHSLKFSRERITCLHLPFHSKWLYVGTERGNVHIVNVETFSICGYTINWNKAIELSRKTHPGPVVHLSDNPMDSNKLLIGFETGLIVCWDLKCKMAEERFNSTESLRDACWHQEGKLFMCSYADGTLSTWNFKQNTKPVSVMTPHSKANKSGSISPCKPINRVEWKSLRASEPYIIFSGGMSFEASRSPCLTIMHGKDVTVLEMEHKILDFVVLCKNLFSYDYDEPYAIAVLLSSDLIFIDMLTPGYPCFQCPYSLDIHESPVTCLKYISDCASDLVPAMYSSGTKQKRKGFSSREFPVKGGEASTGSCSYSELLITGHADGSAKFWDVCGMSMQFLYRMRTSKQFEKLKSKDSDDDDLLAIQHIYLDEDSRLLALAGAHHLTLHNYSKKETTSETPVIEISAASDIFEEVSDSPTSPKTLASNGVNENSLDITSKPNLNTAKEVKSAVKAKTGSRKHAVGYQPQLSLVLKWCDTTTPPIITCICVNSSYGMLAAGTTSSIFIIDILQNKCLLNVAPSDLCNNDVGRLATPGTPKSWLQSGSSTDQEKMGDTENNPKTLERRNSHGDETSQVIFELVCATPSSETETDKMDFLNLNRNRSTSSPSLPLSGHLEGKTEDPPSEEDEEPTSSSANNPKPKWTRKLTNKMGNMKGKLSHLPHKHPPHHSKSQSALPINTSATGFFADQKPQKKNKIDKLDGGLLSRSRSPSTSSLDMSAGSEVQFLTFADTYSRKQSEDTTSGLWIGTNSGTLIALDIIPCISERSSKPAMIAHSGTSFQLKGTILELCFLDSKGFLVPVEATSWGVNKGSAERKGKGLASRVSRLSSGSADGLEPVEQATMHIVTMCSDSELRSVSLPSQSVLFKEKFPDGMFAVHAKAIICKESPCLACLSSTGTLLIYSLPSLRPLLNYNFFADLHIRVLRTFGFSNHGHAMYMCSANEVQKITVSADMCRAHPEMQCEPFLAKDNPEPPKQNFLKTLFGSGPSKLDREELFGSAGKASGSVAKFVPGAALREAQANTSGVMGEMARTRIALDERGEKLGRLDERSEALKERAKEFSRNAEIVADRYKNLKWYQF